MLKITVPAVELWDPSREQFFDTKEHTLCLEHSLVSVSKWEMIHCKPFLGKEQKTAEEIQDYIRCMTITQNVDSNIYKILTNENIQEIVKYIEAPMTATWFREDKTVKGRREVMTSEIIYYYMIALNIPFECQKWHLNRLMTLIRVCSEKNKPPKKMGKRQLMSRNKALNEARRKRLNTRG